MDLGRAGANVSRLELDVASLADLAGLTGASWCHCHDGNSTCHAVSSHVKPCQASYYPSFVLKGFQTLSNQENNPTFRVTIVKPPRLKSQRVNRVAPASGEVSRLEKLNLGQLCKKHREKLTNCKRSLAKPPWHKSERLAQPALVSCLVCMSKVISVCWVLGISGNN